MKDKITIYEISVPKSDRESESYGFFKNKDLGLKISSGKGWYGSSGTAQAIEVTEIEGVFYKLTKVCKVSDVNMNEDVRQGMIDNIKSKLTAEELTLLGL